MPSILMVTVDEKFNHPRELEEMMPYREQITGTVALMHGHSDWIVPVENSYFMIDQLTNAQLEMPTSLSIACQLDIEYSRTLPYVCILCIGMKS